MGKSPIWGFQCASRILKILTDIRDRVAFSYLDDMLAYLDDFDLRVDHLRKRVSNIKRKQQQSQSEKMHII